MKTVCDLNMCTGCMACVEKCPHTAIKIVDHLDRFNACINENKCVNCGACFRVCQRNAIPESIHPMVWYQGWAADEAIRLRAASGGVATALMKAFADKMGYVCSCVFRQGNFVFEITDNSRQVDVFSGSKYIKSNPYGIYGKIKGLLNGGKKVLFVGLPCQVAALKKYIGANGQDNLYTVDLICHGTPSPKLLQLFLKEHGYEIDDIENMVFREKTACNLYKNYTSLTKQDMPNRYLFSFLKALNYTENCYSCPYARLERVSDITLGDSWGSKLPKEEHAKGISLILCQSEKGKELLESADLHLEEVDIENAVKCNQQLNAPAKLPPDRKKFFEDIRAGKKYDHVIFKLFPSIFIRQYGKRTLKKIGVMKETANQSIVYKLLINKMRK